MRNGPVHVVMSFNPASTLLQLTECPVQISVTISRNQSHSLLLIIREKSVHYYLSTILMVYLWSMIIRDVTGKFRNVGVDCRHHTLLYQRTCIVLKRHCRQQWTLFGKHSPCGSIWLPILRVAIGGACSCCTGSQRLVRHALPEPIANNVVV
jgi:hypothetical protein